MSALKRSLFPIHSLVVSIGIALSVLSRVQAITSAQDFQNRCNVPGVFKCVSFDTGADFVTTGGWPTQTVYPSLSDGNIYAVKDCSMAVDGCSLRLTIPANNIGTSAGYWTWVFSQNGGLKFSQNTDVYVQFRTRMDANMVNQNFGGEGWKQFGFSGYGPEGTTCNALGLVTQNFFYRGFPGMMYSCSPAVQTLDSQQVEFLEQAPSPPNSPYNCGYVDQYNGNKSNCAVYHADEWETYYYHFHIGHWGQNDGSIDAWVGYGNGPLNHFIYQSTWTYNYQLTPNDGYDYVVFYNYITSRDANASNGQPGNMWYDELILSTQPIAAPGGTPPPPPSSSPCDVNGDGVTNVADVQLEVNMALGISTCTNASGTCTVVSVQRVVNAALGGTCVSP